MPLGSSSDAPVMIPGPTRPMRPSLFVVDARAGGLSFTISAMRMTSRVASTPPAESGRLGQRSVDNRTIPLGEPRFPDGVEYPTITETKHASDECAGQKNDTRPIRRPQAR